MYRSFDLTTDAEALGISMSLDAASHVGRDADHTGNAVPPTQIELPSVFNIPIREDRHHYCHTRPQCNWYWAATTIESNSLCFTAS
jgi:hypothetical protein